MDQRRLRYFLAVAEEENIHAAADRLHVAQSALSRHIKALEVELGFQLFSRFSRGTALTEAGRVFKGQAARLLHEYEDAVLHAQAVSEGKADILNVGLNEVTARNSAKIVAILSEFRSQNPSIKLQVNFLTSQHQGEKLYESAIDLALMFNAPSDRRILTSHTLETDTYELVVPRKHPLADKPRIVMADLEHEQFIVQSRYLNRSYYDLVFGRMIAGGVTPKIYQEAGTEDAMIYLVAIGLGISFVHGSNRTRGLPDITMRPVSDLAVKLELKAVWKTGNRSAPLKRLTDLLLQHT